VQLNLDLPRNLVFLKINEHELEINKHLKIVAEYSSKERKRSFNRSDQLVVTLGHKGCKYMGKIYPPPRRVVAQDLSGAGDTFLAALAVSMTKTGDAEAAINFANECSTRVVTKRGVATV
jgi:sugar/nucleoside kinase (ribokinase family)